MNLSITVEGKPADRDGVLHVRDELVRLGFPQLGPDEGFSNDKETYREPLLLRCVDALARYDADDQ